MGSRGHSSGTWAEILQGWVLAWGKPEFLLSIRGFRQSYVVRQKLGSMKTHEHKADQSCASVAKYMYLGRGGQGLGWAWDTGGSDMKE